MTRKTVLCGALLAFATLDAAPAPAARKLADFRRVVVADQAPEVQRAAAGELALYVGRIAGTKIETVPVSKYSADAPGLSFFVGDAAAQEALKLSLAPWKDEEWLLRTVPGGLVVAGQDGKGDPWSTTTPAGTMLAAYVLLDDYLGVKWFWPGPFGEHVPTAPDAVVPDLDLRATPRFMIRSIQLGYPSTYHVKEFNESARRWARRARLGWTRSAVFGHSWFDAFNLRTRKSFEEHPDWFALVNGKRQPPQMCTTHPEVIARMVEHVLKGKQDIMHISPSDGGGFCQCNEQTKSETHRRLGVPSCTSLDVPGLLAYDGKSPQLSDRIFTYANDVARRVREQDPAKGCGMFAYTFYNKPPVRIKQLEPNLYLSFVYQAAALRDPEAYQAWKDSVAGWQALGAKMVVREGWGNHYYLDLPFLQYDQIVANLHEAARLGFIAAYGEGSKSFATQAPNCWAVVRMMWDPARDGAKMMEEFWPAAYGPVAPEMKAFFEAYNGSLNRNWAKRRRILPTSGIAYANLINSWNVILPKEAVEEAERHLAAAEKKAPPGEYADRVAFHRFGQDYTRAMLELLDGYRQLTELGVALDAFKREAEQPLQDPARKQALLKRAYDLGETRERMLLEHRDWAAMDEGLYAFANDSNLRQWHARVKKELGIDTPTALTKAKLQGVAPAQPRPVGD
jgi:hypothetical protein